VGLSPCISPGLCLRSRQVASGLWTASLVCKQLCSHLCFREDLGGNQLLPSTLVSPHSSHMAGQTLISHVCGSCTQHKRGSHLQHEFHLPICSNLLLIDQACKVKTKAYRAGKGLPAMPSSVAFEKPCFYCTF